MPVGATKVQESCTAPGTADATLIGNTFGHVGFNDAGLDGIAVYYQMDNLDYDLETGDWEVGTGT